MVHRTLTIASPFSWAGGKLMSITRREKFVKTIALLAYFFTVFLVVLGSAQDQNNNHSRDMPLARKPGWRESSA
jgi:hypothetical protein